MPSLVGFLLSCSFGYICEDNLKYNLDLVGDTESMDEPFVWRFLWLELKAWFEKDLSRSRSRI